MYSTKLSVSIHILSVVAMMDDTAITSDFIASSINTNPALVRRLMSNLKKANLIETKTKLGVTGLARPKESIMLLDVFKAVEEQSDLFSIHSNTNHECPVGARIEATLKTVYDSIQRSTEDRLSAISLADIINGFSECE